MGIPPIRVGVVVDASAMGTLAAASQEVASEINNMAEQFMAAGLSSKEAAAALQAVGYSAQEVATALSEAGYAADRAGSSIGGMTSRMGMARVEMAALTGSTGMAEFGFARLIASSAALAPILSALFIPLAAIAFIDILSQMGDAIVKMSDAAVGYTKEAKKAEEEDIKWSKAHESLALTLTEAQQKISATVKEQGDIATLSFGQKWVQAMLDATHSTNVFYAALKDPLIGFTTLSEAEDKTARRAVQLSENLHIESKEWLDLTLAQDKNRLSMLDLQAASEKAGANASEARIAKLKAEIAALDEKEKIEKHIAETENDLKKATGVGGAPAKTNAEIEQQIAIKRIQLTNELATAEAEAAARAETKENERVAKVTAANDAMLAQQRRYAEQLTKQFESEHGLAEKETEMFTHSQEQDVRIATEAAQKEIIARVRYSDETAKIGEESALRNIAAEEAAVTGTARLQEAKLKAMTTSETQRIRIHQDVNAQELADLQKLENDKLAAELKYLKDLKTILLGGQTEQSFVINANPEQLTKLATLNGQIEAAQQTHNARMAGLDRQQQTLNQKTTDDMVQNYMKAFSKMDTAFKTFMDHVMSANRNVGASFIQMAASLEKQWIESLAQRLLQFIQHEAALILAHAAGTQTQVAITQAGVAQQQSISLAAHIKEVLLHAKAAAAGAFHWVMATIPFPIDLILAPAAAAAAFVGTMAFAEQGAIIPKDMPVFAHAGEMVLPRNVSESVQSMANRGAGGGRQTVHVHIAPRESTMTHDDIIRAVKLGIRKGQLSS